MPINEDELIKRFLVAGPETTIEEIYNQTIAKKLWLAVIVQRADGSYAVVDPDQLLVLVRDLQGVRSRDIALQIRLSDLDAALANVVCHAVEQDSMGTNAAIELANQYANKQLVVLRQGVVLGIISNNNRSSATPGQDWINSLPSKQLAHSAGDSPDDVTVRDAGDPIGPGNLGVEDDDTGTTKGDPVAITEEQRFVNVELQDHDKNTPLQTDEVYTLVFDVDLESRVASVVQNVSFGGKFQANEESMDVLIQLASDDFEILSDPQRLKVPRKGKSKNKARFDIQAKHDGPGVINAVLLKNGTDFIQVITIKLPVGGATAGVLSAETQGFDLAAAPVVPHRDVNLTFINIGSGFQVILSSAVTAVATLPITLPELEQIIAQIRKELLEIVYLTGGPKNARLYQTGLDIPPEVNAAALQKLAKAGFRLYQRIFYSPAAGPDVRLMGDKLRELAQKEKLKIRIISQQFLLPWGVLYMADTYEPNNINPELFLGLKHIIEHVPLQPAMQVTTANIPSDGGLNVSLNVNAGIDQQMGMPFIQNQISYWDSIKAGGKTNVIVRKTEDEVSTALADSTTPDHILYFNCHALSKSLAEGGGPDSSCLLLTTRAAALTLGDLNIFAPTSKMLPGAPLVFINACESAELSPLFYDGFVPYFMAKGARGVIGTECETPALFAAAWAERFFDEFLSGKSVGQIFLDLRQEFYAKHNNVMGLLYALYCNGDTRIAPAVRA